MPSRARACRSRVCAQRPTLECVRLRCTGAPSHCNEAFGSSETDVSVCVEIAPVSLFDVRYFVIQQKLNAARQRRWRCSSRSRRPPCIDDCFLSLCSVCPFLRACPITMEAQVITVPRSIQRPRRCITTAAARRINIGVTITRRRVTTRRRRVITSRRLAWVTGLIQTRVGGIAGAMAGTVAVAIVALVAAVIVDRS